MSTFGVSLCSTSKCLFAAVAPLDALVETTLRLLCSDSVCRGNTTARESTTASNSPSAEEIFMRLHGVQVNRGALPSWSVTWAYSAQSLLPVPLAYLVLQLVLEEAEPPQSAEPLRTKPRGCCGHLGPHCSISLNWNNSTSGGPRLLRRRVRMEVPLGPPTTLAAPASSELSCRSAV